MQPIEHISMLGALAEDKVTGFKGVITTVSFDLYGCIQAILTPHVDGKGEILDGKWFDITRLKFDDYRVMNLPDFIEGYTSTGQKGCSDKPIPI